jgi:hypothetical protein
MLGDCFGLICNTIVFAALQVSLVAVGMAVARVMAPGTGGIVRFFLAANAGLALFTGLIFFLGVPGWFGAFVPVGVTALAPVALWLMVRRAGGGAEALRRVWSCDAAALGIICFIALAALGGALNPEVRGDSIIYHMPQALLFVVNGGHVNTPSSALSYIPQNQQLLYAAGLALGGDVLAKLFHWWAGVLLFAGAAALATTLGAGKRAAMWSAALVALVPIWIYLATATYVDFAAANYTLCALLCILLWRELKGGPALLPALGAYFLGAAMGVKYTAWVVGFVPLVAVLAALLAVDTAARTRDARQALTTLAVFAGVAVLVVSPWLVRNFLWTGNPLAPSFMRLLGPAGVPESTLGWPDIQAGDPSMFLSPGRWLAECARMFGAFSDYGNFLPSIALLLGIVATLLGARCRARSFPPPVRVLVAFLVVALLIGVPLAAVRRDGRYVMAHVAVVAVLAVRWFETIVASLPLHARLLRHVAASAVAVLCLSWAGATWMRFDDLNESLLPITDPGSRLMFVRDRIAGWDANTALGEALADKRSKVLGAGYPARVNFVLGGAPLTPDLAAQRAQDLTTASLPALRRQNVRFVFGEVSGDVAPALVRVGEYGGVPLLELAGP